MKKAVFIGSAGSVANVYSPEVMSALHDELTFETDHVIAKNELDSYFDTLSHADYIFSTWGIPHFTREEQARCRDLHVSFLKKAWRCSARGRQMRFPLRTIPSRR